MPSPACVDRQRVKYAGCHTNEMKRRYNSMELYGKGHA